MDRAGRTAIITVSTILSTIGFGMMAICLSFLDRHGRVPHKVARIWARSILMVSGVPVRVEGLAHVDPDRPAIYMANHQSLFDIPVLLAHLPVQFRWLAKAELFTIPLFGYAMRRAGYISIDRSDRKSAFQSLKRAALAIREGASVLIFPEGTRSADGSIGLFKKGGFILAVDAGVPVVPVVVHGTRAIMPKQTFRIAGGSVSVRLHPPVMAGDYSRRTKDALIHRIRAVIMTSFNADGIEAP